MIKKKYYFLNDLDDKFNFFSKWDEDFESILEVSDQFSKMYNSNHYLIDTLPMRMDNNFIYSTYFNIHHNGNIDNSLGYNFNYYYYKFQKIIMLLIGYDNSLTFFESSILYNKDLLAEMNDSTLSQLNKNGMRILSLSEIKYHDILKKLLDLSLKEISKTIFYFTQLNIIIEVDGLIMSCLIFDNFELLNKVVVTEGLYLY